MARLFNGAASDYCSVDAVPVTTYPLTFGCWFYPTASQNTVLMWLGDKDSDVQRHALVVETDGDVTYSRMAGGSNVIARTTASYSLNTWNMAVCVGISATDASIFLNGGNQVTSTTDATPTGLDRYAIGMRRSATPGGAFTGLEDRCFVYSAALTPAEVAALYAVGSPLMIRRESLRDYRKLGYFAPEPNWVGPGNAMTVVGAVRDYGTPGVVERPSISAWLPSITTVQFPIAPRQYMHPSLWRSWRKAQYPR